MPDLKNFKSPSEVHMKDGWALCPEKWGKLLRMDDTGLYVWCKQCKTEHKITFESLRAD
jgi:hypothetical protein